ncbi:unnamed protein product [Brassica rapa subsp. trilocularis]
MRRCLYFSPSVSPTTMNSISSFPKDLMKTLKRTFYETRETRDINETRDLNKGGELIEVDMLLDEKGHYLLAALWKMLGLEQSLSPMFILVPPMIAFLGISTSLVKCLKLS